MPTALESTREERKKYLQSVQLRPTPSKLSPTEQRARDELLARVRQAALSVKQRWGARQIILFGSLAHGAWFAPDSDVDVANEFKDNSKPGSTIR